MHCPVRNADGKIRLCSTRTAELSSFPPKRTGKARGSPPRNGKKHVRSAAPGWRKLFFPSHSVAGKSIEQCILAVWSGLPLHSREKTVYSVLKSPKFAFFFLRRGKRGIVFYYNYAPEKKANRYSRFFCKFKSSAAVGFFQDISLFYPTFLFPRAQNRRPPFRRIFQKGAPLQFFNILFSVFRFRLNEIVRITCNTRRHVVSGIGRIASPRGKKALEWFLNTLWLSSQQEDIGGCCKTSPFCSSPIMQQLYCCKTSEEDDLNVFSVQSFFIKLLPSPPKSCNIRQVFAFPQAKCLSKGKNTPECL